MINKISKKLRTLCVMLLATATMAAWGNSAYIYAKAYLAQWLIASAWQQTLVDGKHHRPWEWADTWPIAKLYVPANDIKLIVLAGSSGTSLAFGPGHIDGTALPEEAGTKVFSGHRDTHFAFLQHIEKSDVFYMQDKHSQWQRFEFEALHVVDIREGEGRWPIEPDKNQIHFITCYPFDALVPGGPLRFVAIASKAPEQYAANELFLF